MPAEPVLQISNLVAGYVPGVDILHGVDIHLDRGEIVSIVGPNGSGKSTLVKSIVGLLRPRQGTVHLHGNPIAGDPSHRTVRKGLGYVPQRENVFPSMTVEENLRLGCVGRRAAPESERLHATFTLFPRLEERRRQRAGTLSGGERQMLAIARTLMPEPDVLLLDEPSAALSPLLVDVIFEKILEINSTGTSILLVEQNARRALAMSQRGYVLEAGRNRFHGRGRELLDDEKIAELYLGGGRTEKTI